MGGAEGVVVERKQFACQRMWAEGVPPLSRAGNASCDDVRMRCLSRQCPFRGHEARRENHFTSLPISVFTFSTSFSVSLPGPKVKFDLTIRSL